MENFAYWSPTKYVLERGAEKKAGGMIAPMSAKALFVHAGEPFLYSSGLHGRIMDSLKEAGIEVFELPGVVPNPVLSLVRKGIDLCKQSGIGFVLAAGGGSVVDTAKAVALGALYDGDVWDFYCGKASPEASLPVGAVMTFPATGSEASNGSVITNEATGEKRDVMGDVVRPAFCLMNPELTYSLPSAHTAFGIADMFSHVTERYFSHSQNVELTDCLCEGAMRAILACGRKVMKDGKDYDARANLMWASIIAHNGILGTGRNQDWSTHMMGAPLSGAYNSVHGGTIAVLLPVWAEYVMDAAPERFAQFAEQVFGIPRDPDNLLETARQGIAGLKAYFKELGLPSSLRELGVTDQDKLPMLAGQACFGGTIGCVKGLSAEDIVKIYSKAF